MKNTTLSLFFAAFGLIASSMQATAQFIADSSQTYFVCNATGTQTNVSSFGDANGGTYSLWIDKRNGATGTAIYGQHLDSTGVPMWPVNGKLFFQENAKDIWLLKAVPWQSGILVTWVQGGFGTGGDTLFCNYYSANGVSQWAQPTVAGNKQTGIIYVNYDDLDIYPNDSGATVTFALTQLGGNSVFAFNRIGFTGNLRWPLDSYTYQGNGYYYHTGYDNHNGFYVATSTGGLGTPIYMGHFDLFGNLTIPTPINICGTAGGRGNSQWKVICDNDTNAYIVWSSYTNSDITISKIKPNGTLTWSDAKPICAAGGIQDIPEIILKNNTLYATWDDGRPGSIGNYDIYMQKLDTAGNPLWAANGILLSHLSSYIPYPKLVASGNNIVATFVVNGGFRGQTILPNGTTVWHQDGVVVNVNNTPFYGDYQLVAAANGSVTAIWHESGDNICAARIRPNGTLTNVTDVKETSTTIFPNPVKDQLVISANCSHQGLVIIKMYNSAGKLIYSTTEKNVEDVFSRSVSVKDFAPGIYTVSIEATDFLQTKKVVVVN